MENKKELNNKELNEIAGGGTVPIVEVEECPFCKQDILKSYLEKHEKNCPKRPKKKL